MTKQELMSQLELLGDNDTQVKFVIYNSFGTPEYIEIGKVFVSNESICLE